MIPDGREALAQRIRRWMFAALDGAPPEPFEHVAVNVARWQAQHGPANAALGPDRIDRIDDIPCVPVDVYKAARVGTVPTGLGVVFRTSGTTQGARGEHALWSTDLYDPSSLAWARRCVPRITGRVVALLLDPAAHPDSSLSHMVAMFGAPGVEVTWALRDGLVDVDRARRAVHSAAGPIVLATTSFALADWLDAEPGPLPPGSTLMVTGGFKGRRVEMDERGLLEAADAHLRPCRLISEYGMTELSSQLWAMSSRRVRARRDPHHLAGARRSPPQPSPAGVTSEPRARLRSPGPVGGSAIRRPRYRPPPWLRPLAVDPATGALLPAEVPGQLRFLDLANLDSAIGVETMDVGVVHRDGTVSLRGRITDADARGCSLTVEEAWERGGAR